MSSQTIHLSNELLSDIKPCELNLGPSETPQLTQLKVVEHGFINICQKFDFILLFESVPIWSFALDPPFVHSLCFPGFQSLSDLLSQLQLPRDSKRVYEHVLNTYSSDQLIFDNETSTKKNMIILISGTLKFFIDQLSVCCNKHFLFVSDTHSRIRSLPQCTFELKRIAHYAVGGASKFQSVWTSSSPHLRPAVTQIRRTLGAFIDHSIRPDPVSKQSVFKHLEPSHRIHPLHLSTPILYQSYFSATGFGSRSLTLPELAHIFGHKTNVIPFLSHDNFINTPVQILDALLQPFLLQLSHTEPLQRTQASRIPTPPPVDDDAPVLLPNLQILLPNEWKLHELSSNKAARSDDAEIQFDKWDKRITSLWNVPPQALASLRSWLLHIQFRRLSLEFFSYLKQKYGALYLGHLSLRFRLYLTKFQRRLGGVSWINRISSSGATNITSDPLYPQLLEDLLLGKQALASYLGSTFFGWDNGSTLLYWRWHSELQEIAKHGFTPYIIADLPNSFKRPLTPKQNVYTKILSKVTKALSRGYLVPMKSYLVKNLIDYFGVEKAIVDIRVVFNGTSCGFNDAVWAPNFWLPTAKSMTRILGYNYKSVDIDLGEMFLNFPLNSTLQSYSGVDLGPFREDLNRLCPSIAWPDDDRTVAVWTRTWMGFRPSPEWACRYYYLAEEFVRGDERDVNNPMRWDTVILNLLGNEDFNPALPNVMKWNRLAKRIAGDLKSYVDDLRAVGWSLEHAWVIARWVASRLQYLGIQDAPRKRRIDNGPWAGTIYLSSDRKIQKTVSQEKWNKGRDYILEISKQLQANTNYKFEFKYLERVRGFLCHLAMTYEILFPYLKGFHLTLCSHLPRRNEEGWKTSNLEWIGHLEMLKEKGIMSDLEVQAKLDSKFNPMENKSKFISVLPRFMKCLTALKSFFNQQQPSVITERSRNVQFVIYGFADASKSGFGASLDFGAHTKYRIGVWGSDGENESSNFREFANVVETLEEEEDSGALDGCMLILATDNSTVESCLHKGNSSSEKLYDLIVRLRSLELRVGARFLISHVSGHRMQAQGTDGISRGYLREGISLGEAMLKFCPWGQSALERSPSLVTWLKEVFGNDLEILSPSQWFTRGHDHDGGYKDDAGFWRLKLKSGSYLWHPPPAAADAALEEARKARLKRRESMHIFVIPRLMQTMWMKQLFKFCDLIFPIEPTHTFWPSKMYEPILIGIAFPYLPFRPWQLRSTPKLLAMARQMRSLSKEDSVDAGNILSKFLHLTKRLPTMQQSMVWKVLYFKSNSEVSSP